MEIYIHGKLMLQCYEITHFDPPNKKEKVKRGKSQTSCITYIYLNWHCSVNLC